MKPVTRFHSKRNADTSFPILKFPQKKRVKGLHTQTVTKEIVNVEMQTEEIKVTTKDASIQTKDFLVISICTQTKKEEKKMLDAYSQTFTNKADNATQTKQIIEIELTQIRDVHTQTEEIVNMKVDHIVKDVQSTSDLTITNVTPSNHFINSPYRINNIIRSNPSQIRLANIKQNVQITNQYEALSQVMKHSNLLFKNHNEQLVQAIKDQLAQTITQQNDHYFTIRERIGMRHLFYQSQRVRDIVTLKNLNVSNWNNHLFDIFMLKQSEPTIPFSEEEVNRLISEVVTHFPPNLVKLVITPIVTDAERRSIPFLNDQSNKFRVTGQLQPLINTRGEIVQRIFNLSQIEQILSKLEVKFPSIQIAPFYRDNNLKMIPSILKGMDNGGMIWFFEDGVFELMGFNQFQLMKKCIQCIVVTSLRADLQLKKINEKTYNAIVTLLRREITLSEYYSALIN
jgi:hypothetical protein